MHRDGCSCQNAALASHLGSEPEEVNVASGVVAMGRSGGAGRIRAAEGRMPTLATISQRPLARLEICRFNNGYARSTHFVDRRRGVALVDIDAAACVCDERGLKTRTDTVECGRLDAIIGCEPAEKHSVHVPIFQINVQTCGPLFAIVEKATVTVDRRVSSFLENFIEKLGAEFGGEISPRGSLNAMDRPEYLRYSVQLNDLAGDPVWVVSGETPVFGRMPVLSGKDEVELMFLHYPVYHRNHLVPVSHGQRSAR